MLRKLRDLRFAAVAIPVLFPISGPIATAAEAPPHALVTAQAQPADLSDALLISFAAAATKILDIREKYLPQIRSAPNEEEASQIFKKAQTEMRAILTVENLTEAQYNEVVDAARADPALAGKIQKMIDKNKDTTKK